MFSLLLSWTAKGKTKACIPACDDASESIPGGEIFHLSGAVKMPFVRFMRLVGLWEVEVRDREAERKTDPDRRFKGAELEDKTSKGWKLKMQMGGDGEEEGGPLFGCQASLTC